MHPIEGDELRAIRRYLAARSGALPWLFVSERRGRLTRFAINYLVAETAHRANLAAVHPHMLRHSCGYALADKDVPLRVIQEWPPVYRDDGTLHSALAKEICGDLAGLGRRFHGSRANLDVAEIQQHTEFHHQTCRAP